MSQCLLQTGHLNPAVSVASRAMEYPNLENRVERVGGRLRCGLHANAGSRSNRGIFAGWLDCPSPNRAPGARVWWRRGIDFGLPIVVWWVGPVWWRTAQSGEHWTSNIERWTSNANLRLGRECEGSCD